MMVDDTACGYNRTYAQINLSAIRKNIDTSRKALPEGTGIIAVIKTDAYGHGAVRVAKAIENMTAGFAVATIDEAVELRQAVHKSPIIILR